jgi:hydroxymethylglutaryl-CoA lyase
VLTPNMKGLESALAVGVREVAVFAAASESFSRRNINCTIAESLERYTEVCRTATAAGVAIRGYVSTVLGCPYEGDIKPEAVADVTRRLMDLGCYEVSLGDTIGVGTAGTSTVQLLLESNDIAFECVCVCVCVCVCWIE